MKIWIAQIEISRAVDRKIRAKHNLTAHEVRASLVARSDISAFMDVHPVHGQRIAVRAIAFDGKILLAWLVPSPNKLDVYRLVTARKDSR